MFQHARTTLRHAIALLLLLAAFPQESQAQDIFKSSEFLKWQPKSQAMYIETSLGMASLIAAQNNKQQASCIDDWYYKDEAGKNEFILSIMKNYPDYHPRGVILGVIEKQCGQF